MVFLALSRRGFMGYQQLGQASGCPLWVMAGVLSDAELDALRESGVDITNFDYGIASGDQAAIACAAATVKEHHPDQCVWVEA